MSHEPIPCPHCGRRTVEGAAFCPFCGAALPKRSSALSPEGEALLGQAGKTSDPVEKHRLLLRARALCPDCLEVEEALLFLGRLYERNPRKMDFSVIKCYLWHMYLTPGDFSPEKREAMRQELLHDPQLERCQELSGDAARYFLSYLERLAGEFVSLFLLGSNRYTNAFLGFRLDPRMDKVLASPVASMLQNIWNDGRLEDGERDALSGALYRAFLAQTGGNAAWVDARLKELGLPVPKAQQKE